MDVVALIPARGGSKGLPRKNLRELAGIPLIAHAIRQARAARTVTRVIVSTDDPEIASVARTEGAEVPFLRPARFATDDATDLDVFKHALEFLQETEGRLPDLLAQVRATSPVRRPEVIDLAVTKLSSHPEADSLRSVSLATLTPYKMWAVEPDTRLRPILSPHMLTDWYDLPRQKLPDVFVQDGLIDVVRPATVLGLRSMAGRTVLGLLHPEPAVDIDDLSGLRRAAEMMAVTGESGPGKPGPVGIIQGRLTPSWTGELQCFPKDHWKDEFDIAAKLGFDYLELLIDRRYNPDNPIWTQQGRDDLRAASARTKVATHAACLDYTIDHDIRADGCADWLRQLAPKLAQVAVKTAVLPMMEASELSWPVADQELVPILRSIGDAYGRCGIRLCLETTLAGPALYELLGLISHRNVGACYDIGNSTALGHATVADVGLLGPAIWHVHVKDKNRQGDNVPLGDGDADLGGVFSRLAASGYRGGFSLETTRGDDAVDTARKHHAMVTRYRTEAAGQWA